MNSSSNATATAPVDPTRIDRAVWRIAAVVIIGSFMSIIDMTIVNVALEALGRDLKVTRFDDIQWVVTSYMLAVAAVIPITGWASARFGARRLWIGSLALFTISSALCAAAWSLESLVAFRVAQGVAGGMVMPVGQMLLARAAGPQRMGRVMGIVGIPVLLAPVLGPVLGGLILDSLSWQWIFLVNVPVGIAGVALSLRLLPDNALTRPAPRSDVPALDRVGLALLSIGLPLVVYGLANIASLGFSDGRTWLPLVTGFALTAIFVWHAWNAEHPLLDVRLFTSRAFSMAALTSFTLGASLFGSMILLPLYYQLVRGESVLMTGLLMAPQGIGAGIGIAVSSRLTDRIGGGIVTIVGLIITIIATIPFTQLDASSGYTTLNIAMLVRGIGFGATMMPSMAAAFAAMRSDQIPHATPQLNVLQRVGGAIGTAILATVLQHELTAAVPHTGAARVMSATHLKLPPSIADALGGAFGTTFMWVIGFSIISFIPATLLAVEERRVRQQKAADHLDAHHAHETAEAAIVGASGDGPSLDVE